MKKLILWFALMIFVTACGTSVTSTPIATSMSITSTSTPIPASTSAPTFAPTLIPTVMIHSKVLGDYPAIKYTNGVEVADVPNGGPVVFDLQDKYAVIIPTGWKAGALDPDFLPIIERYGQPNPYIKGVFGYFLQTSADTIRVFAFDASPEHLNDHSYVWMVFKVLTDAGSLGKTIDQLGMSLLPIKLPKIYLHSHLVVSLWSLLLKFPLRF